jgi:hypothetical protein
VCRTMGIQNTDIENHERTTNAQESNRIEKHAISASFPYLALAFYKTAGSLEIAAKPKQTFDDRQSTIVHFHLLSVDETGIDHVELLVLCRVQLGAH